MQDAVAREMWPLFEPVHAVTYFAPETFAAFQEAGLRGFWRGYFAGRSAALGAVGPAPVVAAFYGFAPAMVERALPSIWSLASPEQALAARYSGAVAALRRLAGDQPVDEAASLLSTAAAAADVEGRVLAAAHAALPEPEEPFARLWHAVTILREHRGDGHVAALLTAGVGACESLVLRTGDDMAREALQPHRGWTDEEWEAAGERLRSRGWVDASGTLTDAGRELRRSVEAVTDAVAMRPWRAVGEEGVERLRSLLRPLSDAAFAAMPAQTPLGLPPRG